MTVVHYRIKFDRLHDETACGREVADLPRLHEVTTTKSKVTCAECLEDPRMEGHHGR